MTTDKEALHKLFEAALKQPDPTPSRRPSQRMTPPARNAAFGASAPTASATAVAESKPRPTTSPDRRPAHGESRKPSPKSEDKQPSTPTPAPDSGKTEIDQSKHSPDRSQTTRELQAMLKEKNYRDHGRRKRMAMILSLACGAVLAIGGAWFLSDGERRESIFFSAEKIRADADMNRYASGEALTLTHTSAPGEEVGNRPTPENTTAIRRHESTGPGQ